MLRLAALLLMLLSVFQLDAQPPSYRYLKNACPFDHAKDVAVECGTLVVPEDRGEPAGNQVRLAVAVFAALEQPAAPDPIFYLDGGPGSSTLLRWGSGFAYTFSEFNRSRDVVLIDYRGAGASEPSLFCDEVSDYMAEIFDGEMPDKMTGQEYVSALDRCHKRLVDDEHVNLGMYRSAIIARDISDLREALGYREINLMGASYGTRLALTILRDQPAGIRSVLLDGVYPPQVDRGASTIVNANRAFEELFTVCARSTSCNAAFPDLRGRFYDAAIRLNKVPAMLHVDTLYGEDGGDVQLNGNTFINYIFNALYSTWLIPSLPLIITGVADGNYEQMAQVMGGSIDSESSLSLGLYLSIECSDEMPFTNRKDAIAASERVPLLGRFFLQTVKVSGDSTPDTCLSWGVESPDPIENEPVTSQVPVLIFNGEFDPITPPNWGELAAQTLPNSRVITFPGMGHVTSLSGSACAQEIAVAFFASPDDQTDTSCIVDAPIQWVTVDLRDSLATTEAELEASGRWYLESQRSSVFWNSDRWTPDYGYGLLVITDYATTSFPGSVDTTWFNRVLSGWGKYRLQAECARGSLSLYELAVDIPDSTEFAIRYWVDRSHPDIVRDVLLALPHYSETDFKTDSEKLFPELPGC